MLPSFEPDFGLQQTMSKGDDRVTIPIDGESILLSCNEYPGQAKCKPPSNTPHKKISRLPKYTSPLFLNDPHRKYVFLMIGNMVSVHIVHDAKCQFGCCKMSISLNFLLFFCIFLGYPPGCQRAGHLLDPHPPRQGPASTFSPSCTVFQPRPLLGGRRGVGTPRRRRSLGLLLFSCPTALSAARPILSLSSLACRPPNWAVLFSESLANAWRI